MANMGLFITFLLCINWLLFIEGSKLHDHLTDEEVKTIFKVPREQVPDYEVVKVAHNLHEENKNAKLYMKAFGQVFDLNLQPSSLVIGANTPIYLAYNGGPGGVRYQQVSQDPSIRTFFDENQNTIITTGKNPTTGNVDLHGAFGDNLVLQPFDNSILDSLPTWTLDNDNEHYGDEITYTSDEDLFNLNNLFVNNPYVKAHHIVYKTPKRNASQSESMKKYVSNFVNVKQGFDVVDTVYPEILVTVDYESLRIHGNNYNEVVKYLSVFWNAVDLKYREIKSPKIRLNIAGIIIPMERGAAPYFENYSEGKYVSTDSLLALGYFRNHAFFKNKNFDIAFALTSLDLISESSPILTGASFVSGACDFGQSILDRSAGIGEDDGSFSGILMATHELGHIFGCPHDGEDNAVICPKDEYIMGPVETGENVLFSPCSKAIMEHQLMSPETQCLRNKPYVQYPYSMPLPGQILSADKQCHKILEGSSVAVVDESMCSSLQCMNKNTLYVYHSTHGAANGTPCGPNKVCFERQCVASPKMI